MIPKLKTLWNKADDVIFRYPTMLVMAFLAAVSSVIAVEKDHEDYGFVFIKFAWVAALGISLMFGVKMWSQRIGKQILLEILALLFLIAFFFYLPESEDDFKVTYGYVLAVTVVLTHLFASFSAFLNRVSEINFWQFNKNIFINIFLTVVFTGVLVGGILLAIVAVDQLFDLDFNSRIYPKTFLFLSIFGSCFIFCLFNENGLPYLEKNGNYPEILKFFTQFVLIPLLIIYVVILYFYSFKILINWELPRGWVSYLILAYSVIGILALLLIHPLKEDVTKSWVKLFSKIFFFTLIPLLILLFIAIFTRILEYGYTEPRYFVLILSLWLTAVVVYFIFFRKATIKFIPVSLFVFGVFALIFPYANAFSVAKRSQKNELSKLLISNGLLKNGTIDFSKTISKSLADDVGDKFSFLSERKQNDELFALINKNKDQELYKALEKAKRSYVVSQAVSSHFKIKATDNSLANQSINLQNLNTVYSVENYDFLINLGIKMNETYPLPGNELKVKSYMNDDNMKFLISLKSGEEINIAPDLLAIIHPYLNKTGNIPVHDISVEKDLGEYHFKIYFSSLSFQKYSKNDTSIYFGDAVILIRKK